jgi:hypothetical protein
MRGMTLHLAQLNIGRLVAPLDDPRMADFVAGLPVVNAIADASPGFVWRLVDDDGADATGVRPFADPEVAINLSVWESVEALRGFMYRTAHLDFLRRRREWFTVFGQPYAVSWWVPAGHRPTVEEAVARLELLKSNGSTAEAFALRDADLVGSP